MRTFFFYILGVIKVTFLVLGISLGFCFFLGGFWYRDDWVDGRYDVVFLMYGKVGLGILCVCMFEMSERRTRLWGVLVCVWFFDTWICVADWPFNDMRERRWTWYEREKELDIILYITVDLSLDQKSESFAATCCFFIWFWVWM